MKIIIAPDSFKECLNAAQVATALAEGLRKVLPAAELVLIPMADGGEGTLLALTTASGARLETVTVMGAVGVPLAARYGILADACTAVIEVAEAIGLDKLPREQRAPRATTSYGVGQMILSCLDRGLRQFIIGLGGSATVDGGAGMLQALGVSFLDRAGGVLPAPLRGGRLADIAALDITGLDARLMQARFDIACDVDNPLCGARGAAAVFGPQKGASPDDVVYLDGGLRHLYDLLENAWGQSVAERPGAGAAGGLGAAFLLALRGGLRPGVDVVMEAVGLEAALGGATVAVTGEGRLDEQTLFGKAPAGVARVARSLGVPVIAVGGSLEALPALWQAGIFDAVDAAVCKPCSVENALRDACPNLVDAGMRVGMWLALCSRVKQSL